MRCFLLIVVLAGCGHGPRPTLAKVSRGTVQCTQYQGNLGMTLAGLATTGVGIALLASPTCDGNADQRLCGPTSAVPAIALMTVGVVMAAAGGPATEYLRQCRALEALVAARPGLQDRSPVFGASQSLGL